jgi:hypothetical protein
MSPVPQHLRDELIVLVAKQLCFLEKETFGVVTKSEILDYESRQEHVHSLYKQLLESESHSMKGCDVPSLH